MNDYSFNRLNNLLSKFYYMNLYSLSIDKLIIICKKLKISYTIYNNEKKLRRHLILQIKSSNKFKLISKKYNLHRGGNKNSFYYLNMFFTQYNERDEYNIIYFNLIQYFNNYPNEKNSHSNKNIMITVPHVVVLNDNDYMGDQLSYYYGWIMYFLLKPYYNVDIFIGNVHRSVYDLNRTIGNMDDFIKKQIPNYDIILDIHSFYNGVDNKNDPYILLLDKDTISTQYFDDNIKKIGTTDNYIIDQVDKLSSEHKIGILIEFTGNITYINKDFIMMNKIIKYLKSLWSESPSPSPLQFSSQIPSNNWIKNELLWRESPSPSPFLPNTLNNWLKNKLLLLRKSPSSFPYPYLYNTHDIEQPIIKSTLNDIKVWILSIIYKKG